MATKKTPKGSKSTPKKTKMVLAKGMDLIGTALKLETPKSSK